MRSISTGLLELCHQIEGCSEGFSGSLSAPGWNIPGWGCGRRTTAARVVQRRHPRRGPTVVMVWALGQLQGGLGAGGS